MWVLFYDTHGKHYAKNQVSRCWIPNPGVPFSKSLSGSKVDSAFHPSEVNKMSIRNFWDLVVKSKLPSQSGSSLDAVEPLP